jgi:hypothetical protein
MTDEQKSTLLSQAQAIAEKAKADADKTNITQGVKDALMSSSSQIQSILNIFLKNGGVLSDEQYNVLDEQTRIAKMNSLQAEALSSIKTFAIYGAFIVALIGVVYFISKK